MAGALGGTPIVALRYSGVDQRPRHRGVSRQTLTALGLAHRRAILAVPAGDLGDAVRAGLAGVDTQHAVAEVDVPEMEKLLGRSRPGRDHHGPASERRSGLLRGGRGRRGGGRPRHRGSRARRYAGLMASSTDDGTPAPPPEDGLPRSRQARSASSTTSERSLRSARTARRSPPRAAAGSGSRRRPAPPSSGCW